MVEQLRAWQAIPIWVPVMTTTAVQSQQLIHALAAVQACEWLVLPSPMAIETFCDFALSRLPPSRWPRTAVMGEASRDLLQDGYGITPAVVYDFAHAASMAEQMMLEDYERVVILKSNQGSGPRVAELIRCHPRVKSHVVYAVDCRENLLPALQRQLAVPFDAVTFTSPSTVVCFMDAVVQTTRLQARLQGICLACIGPATAQTLNHYGLDAQVICRQPSTTSLLRELARWFTSSTRSD